jgi:hypothetical protein
MPQRNLTKALSIAALLTLTAAAQTPAERAEGVRYLTASRDALATAVNGLSEAQWKFKPAPDRWSIAEVVEHLAVVEDLISNHILLQIPQAKAGAADRDARKTDATIVATMADRSVKYHAPPAIVPTGRWTPTEALDHFLSGRAHTLELFQSATGLREHVIDHPAFGPLDGYEWVLAAATHAERHTKQILEVKADPNFPGK